ncbi:hypothetical protein ACFX13_024525 [Malus domestica]
MCTNKFDGWIVEKRFVECVTSRPGAYHFPDPFHRRSTILSPLGLPFPHGFVFGNSRATSQWVTHPRSALASFSLNFGVPTEPEASELTKSLVLGRDGNIHLRITPLGDVGCYNPPPLGARRPRRHNSGQGLALIPFVTSRLGAYHFPGPFHHRSTILSVLGLPFPHGFVFGNSRVTSQRVTHPGSALASFSLNFGVLTEPETSELPKGLVLGRDGNIHLRITPLGDVGCYSMHIALKR